MPPTRNQPTRLGQLILNRMAEVGLRTQIDLAAAAKVGQATVSRLMYDPSRRHTYEVLAAVAAALKMPLETLAAAAYEHDPYPDDIEPTGVAPLAAEFARMLADDSPLDPVSQGILATIVDSVMDPYRKEMRRRANGSSASQ
jgi:transcriptional regulator with XRE-family HTH domain